MGFIIGTPHTRGSGYFSNGLLKGTQQADVQTCPHCQSVILMQEWAKIKSGKMAGGFCTKCEEPICWMCVPEYAKTGCIPFIRKIEEHTDTLVKLDQFRKLAGLEPPEPPRELIVSGT